MPQGTKTEWLALAEKYLAFDWPTIPLTHYLDYTRIGTADRYGQIFFERRSVLGALAIAECLEGKGRFIDQIINGIFCIYEVTTWITPHDLMHQKQTIPPRNRALQCKNVQSRTIRSVVFAIAIS